MIKYANLLAKANLFELLSKANLQSDMAQRIMFSALPSVADKATVELTSGVVDYNALSFAIQGRHDIIKYGTISCVNECKNFEGDDTSQYQKAVQYLQEKNYEKAVEESLNMFSQIKAWDVGYGGKAYINIAKTLLNIIKINKQLEEVKNNYSKRVDVMKQLVVQLNIFDGLSHNTASIMKSILREEMLEKKQLKSYRELDDSDKEELIEKFKEVEKLMNAKELTDPAHVFQEIETTLKGSGDIHKFKDWTYKFRNLPSYRSETEIKENQLKLIKLRKLIIQTDIISKINKLISITENNIQSITSEPQNNIDQNSKFYKILSSNLSFNTIENINNKLQNHLQKLTSFIENMIDTHNLSLDPKLIKYIVLKLEEYSISAQAMENNISYLYKQIYSENAKQTSIPNFKQQLIDIFNNFIKIMNETISFIQSI